ncbi:MAG: hypothetical protein AAF899_18500, partial [Pseudomonadota bacterium]
MTALSVLPRLIARLAVLTTVVCSLVGAVAAEEAETPAAGHAPVLLQDGRGVADLGERLRFAANTGQGLESILAAHRGGLLAADFAAVAGA